MEDQTGVSFLSHAMPAGSSPAYTLLHSPQHWMGHVNPQVVKITLIPYSDGSRGANPAMALPSKLAMEFGPPLGGRKNNESSVNCKFSEILGTG